MSRTQEGFKLIRPNNLEIVRKNVLDSLRAQRTSLTQQHQKITELEQQISQARDSIAAANQTMTEVRKQVDSISFLGANFQKGSYHLMVWSIITVLAVLLLISLIQSQRGRSIARASRENLERTQEEFDQHRKKALEREQKLKRQLQDEINKKNL